MHEAPPLYLLDSSVLFTLHDGNLLNIIWDLQLSFCTTDLILAEWKTVDTGDLIRSGLVIVHLSSDEILEIYRISPQYRKIEPVDLSLFVYAAQHTDCMVITGDKRLRALCEEEGLSVHGVPGSIVKKLMGGI